MRLNNTHTKLNRCSISILIVLLVMCNRWLFDGVIGNYYVSLSALFLGVIVQCRMKFCVKKNSLLLLCFVFASVTSLLISNPSFSRLHQGILFTTVVLYALILNGKLSDYEVGINLLVVLGFANCIAIIVQFLIPSLFRSYYFPLLQSSAYTVATKYFRQGYFSGFNYRPHLAAGTISFALAAIFLRNNKKIRQLDGRWLASKTWLLTKMLLLLLALFMTQKKGILLLTFVSIAAVMMILYGTQKQWHKVLGVVVAVLLLGSAVAFYISRHQENAMFRRLVQFAIDLSSGDSFDSGRGRLYRYAIQLWKEHPLLGIGWRKFLELTISEFGYVTAHQVNLDYLQFLCEMGIVGFLLYTSVILVMLRRSIVVCRTIAKKKLIPEQSWIVYFALFVQIFSFLYGMFEDPFYDIMFFTVYIYSCVIINTQKWEMDRSVDVLQ